MGGSHCSSCFADEKVAEIDVCDISKSEKVEVCDPRLSQLRAEVPTDGLSGSLCRDKVDRAVRDPALLAVEFPVCLQKVEGQLSGLELDFMCGEVMEVCSLHPGGAALAYNKGAGPDRQIREGDFLVEVNGIRADTKAMLEHMKNDRVLKLAISRPTPFSVTVIPSQRVRLQLVPSLSRSRTGRSLLVAELSPPFQEWNESNPDRQVRKHDRIVGVNGCSASAEDLMKEIKEATNLDMLLARPRLDESGRRLDEGAALLQDRTE